jgi:hypothetical protein
LPTYVFVLNEYFYIGEFPKFQNFFVMGQSKRFATKTSSQHERYPKWINIDHTNIIWYGRQTLFEFQCGTLHGGTLFGHRDIWLVEP